MMHHSARLSYAFMLSLLFLGMEILSATLLVAPLHRLLDGVGFPAENYLSGLIIAVLPIAAGAVFRLFLKDRLLVPCAFVLLLIYTAVVTVLCLIRQENEMVLTFLLPTLGVCSGVGNLLFWGVYYAGKK
ncbi:MAG: hypothetical protein IJI61_02725 [Oscillospiraceae bacterium]|nr:hypothetical protein [Oscillospiraceae bacterium]